jgi:hypothetical protein
VPLIFEGLEPIADGRRLNPQRGRRAAQGAVLGNRQKDLESGHGELGHCSIFLITAFILERLCGIISPVYLISQLGA